MIFACLARYIALVANLFAGSSSKVETEIGASPPGAHQKKLDSSAEEVMKVKDLQAVGFPFACLVAFVVAPIRKAEICDLKWATLKDFFLVLVEKAQAVAV